MVRRNVPAPARDAVRGALDAVRVNLEDVGDWLRSVARNGRPVPRGTLHNYRNGRREMPPRMRRMFANQLVKHAERINVLARKLHEASRED
jgi:hypothetical protein